MKINFKRAIFTLKNYLCELSPLTLFIGIVKTEFQKSNFHPEKLLVRTITFDTFDRNSWKRISKETCSPWISARANYQLWHFWLELLNWWKWISKEKCSPWNSALTLLIGIGWIYENEFKKKNVAKEKSCSCKLSALIFLMKMNCSPWKAVHASWF